MKRTPRSGIVLKTLNSQSKTSGPFARLGPIFNHPVLTDSESKALLKEINSSFRNALNESRHPNDIRPPPSINNAYANKADNHIYQVLTDPRPASPPNIGSLRNLLDSKAIADTTGRLERHEKSPITVFQNHLLQGTADIDLAVQCCKKFVLTLLGGPNSTIHPGEGLRMFRMIRGNSVFFHRDDIPKPALRAWLSAALLISPNPTIPFQWLVQYLENSDFVSFRTLLGEVLFSYGKIYNTPESPNENVKFFNHLLRFRDKAYRTRVSEHPTTKSSMRLDSGTLKQLGSLMQDLKEEPGLLEPIVQRLYRRGDDEGKRLLAGSMALWDTQRTMFGVEVLVETGDLTGAADYLVNFTDHKPPSSLSLDVARGLLFAKKLREMREEMNLADQVMQMVEKSLRRLIGGEELPSTFVSIRRTILAAWTKLKVHDSDTDLYLNRELDELVKKIQGSPELENASTLVRRVPW